MKRTAEQLISSAWRRWRGALERGISTETHIGMELARETAPSGEGSGRERKLKESFSEEISASECIVEGRVIVSNPHAAYVEFGTGRRGAETGTGTSYSADWAGMAAQPYMQTTADGRREVFAQGVMQAFSEKREGET